MAASNELSYDVRYRQGHEGLYTIITFYDQHIECPVTPDVEFETIEAILINNMEKEKYRERSFGFKVVEKQKNRSTPDFMQQRSSLGIIAQNFNFVAKHREQRDEILKEILSRLPANETNQAHWETIQSAKRNTLLEIDHSEAAAPVQVYDKTKSDTMAEAKGGFVGSLTSSGDSFVSEDSTAEDPQRLSLMDRVKMLMQNVEANENDGIPKMAKKAKSVRFENDENDQVMKDDLKATRNDLDELRKAVQQIARVSINFEDNVDDDNQAGDQDQDEHVNLESLHFDLEKSYQSMRNTSDKMKKLENQRVAARELMNLKEGLLHKTQLKERNMIMSFVHKLITEKKQLANERLILNAERKRLEGLQTKQKSLKEASAMLQIRTTELTEEQERLKAREEELDSICSDWERHKQDEERALLERREILETERKQLATERKQWERTKKADIQKHDEKVAQFRALNAKLAAEKKEFRRRTSKLSADRLSVKSILAQQHVR